MSAAYHQKLLERFNSKYVVDKNTGCWLWTASRKTNGYGQLCLRNGHVGYAHRISYQLFKGDIAEDLIVCHECDNRSCVNPEHLWLGTPKDNTRDMIRKKRHLKEGVHANAKLSIEEVEEIRKLYATGNYTQKQIAKKFDLTQSYVSEIVLHKTWRHLGGVQHVP